MCATNKAIRVIHMGPTRGSTETKDDIIWSNERIFHQARFPEIFRVPFPLLFTTIWGFRRSNLTRY